jgi:hypothetical protein
VQVDINQADNNITPYDNRCVKNDETHRPMNENYYNTGSNSDKIGQMFEKQVSNDNPAMPIYMENQVNNNEYNMNIPENNISSYNSENIQRNHANENQPQYYGNFNQPNQYLNNNAEVLDSNKFISGAYSGNQPQINQEIKVDYKPSHPFDNSVQKNMGDLPGLEDVQQVGTEGNQNQLNPPYNFNVQPAYMTNLNPHVEDHNTNNNVNKNYASEQNMAQNEL